MSESNAKDLSYVRTEMLPQAEPPAAEIGAAKWVRENLFSSWTNTILTLLSLYVVYAVLSGLVPWLFNSVWVAGSLSECREILAATTHNTDGHSAGGCFAVITNRWLQLIFGFYPVEFYWRPISAFVLLFVALAPILFSDRVPRQLVWFSALYPFLATWLLWGGSFWVPILVIIGFVIGAVVFRFASNIIGVAAGFGAAVVVAFVWWASLMPIVNDGLHRMVANSRMDSALATSTELLETLPVQIAELEASRDALTAEIATIEAAKNETAAQVEALREAGEEVPRDLARQLKSQISAMEDVRADRSDISVLIGQLQGQNSSARTLASNIENLPIWLAELPEQEAAAKELRDALPDHLRNATVIFVRDDESDPNDVALVQPVLDAESAVTSTEIAISGAYNRIGLTGLEPVSSREFGGFMLAIIIGVASIGLSLPLGVMLALGRQSDMMIVKWCSVAFIEIIRGVPLIVWLFTASLLLTYFLPPGTNFDLILRVIIMVTLFSAAYIAEVIRGGLAALEKGQYEAADALGLDYWKSMRLIILPQALKISIPGIVNTFIGLFKDTTLVGIIGLLDPLALSNAIRATTEWNGVYWELFIFIGLMFFIFCYSMGRYSMSLEKKLQRGHR